VLVLDFTFLSEC